MKKIVFILSFVSLFFIFHINTPTISAADKLGDECKQDSECKAVPTPTTGAKIVCKQKQCVIEPAPAPCEKGKFVNGRCTEFKTGLGSISTDAGGFISKIFAYILAASGGIALLLIIRAGYKIMTSEGNPEKVKEGREQLISAIVGLLFLVFSFVLLQLIGVDILKIPGLNK